MPWLRDALNVIQRQTCGVHCHRYVKSIMLP